MIIIFFLIFVAQNKVSLRFMEFALILYIDHHYTIHIKIYYIYQISNCEKEKKKMVYGE